MAGPKTFMATLVKPFPVLLILVVMLGGGGWPDAAWSISAPLDDRHQPSGPIAFNFPDPPREGRPGYFTVAEDGQARCVIVYAANADRPVQVTARRLAAYLGLVTGARFQVQPDRVAIPPGMGAIHVGDTTVSAARPLALPAVRYGAEVFPNVQGFELRTVDPHTLLIRGANPEAVRFGVVGFLERYAGVRQYWLSPVGGIGETLPSRPTLRVPELEWRDWPYFISRSLSMHPLLPAGGNVLDFFRRGGTLPSSENYYRLLPPETFARSNPEYFPLIEGRRWIPPPTSLTSRWQPCVSNPEVARVMADAVIAYFRQNPRALGLNVSVNDGAGDCTCPQCRAMDAPGADYARRTGMSDRYVTFTNRIAKRVAEEFPTKLIVFLAYSAAREPPVAVDLHPNILPVLTVDSAFAAWDRWMKTGARHLGLYLHHNGRTHFVLPKLDVRQSARRIRYLVASGRARVFYQEMHLHWPVTGAVAYVTSRLLWDPRQDVDALLDDYHAGLFGPAARAMRDYHEAVESGYERWREEVGIPHPFAKDASSITGGGSEAQFRVLNLAEANRARAALARAAATPGLDARQAERMALVRAMFDLQVLGVRRYWAGVRLTEPVRSDADARRALAAARDIFATSAAMRRHLEDVLERPPLDQYALFRGLRPYPVSYASLKSGRPGPDSLSAISTGFGAVATFLRDAHGPAAAGAWWNDAIAAEREPELVAALRSGQARSTGIELTNRVSDPGFEDVGAQLAPDERDLDSDLLIGSEQQRALLNLHVWFPDRTPSRAALTTTGARTGRYALMLEHFHRARLGKTVDAEPGARYRAGLWVRCNDRPGNYRVVIGAHRPGSGLPATLAQSPVPDKPNEWREIVADVRAPPETRRISVLLFVSEQASDARCWADDFFIGRYPD